MVHGRRSGSSGSPGKTIEPLPATPSPSKRPGPPHLRLGFCGAGCGYVVQYNLRSGRCGIFWFLGCSGFLVLGSLRCGAGEKVRIYLGTYLLYAEGRVEGYVS